MIKGLLTTKKIVVSLGALFFGLTVVFIASRYEAKETFIGAKKGLQEELLSGLVPTIESLGTSFAPSSYQKFSEISLKIAKGCYSEALKDSIDLRKKTEGQEAEAYLYLLNFYRIGILQGKIGALDEQKESFLALQEIIDGRAPDYLEKASRDLVSILKSDGISLREFLAENIARGTL